VGAQACVGLNSHASQVSTLVNNTTISPCSAGQLCHHKLPGLGIPYSVFRGVGPSSGALCHCQLMAFSLQGEPGVASTFWQGLRWRVN
jgi:hypothetical protein